MTPPGLITSWWLALRLALGLTTRLPVGNVTQAAENRRLTGRAILLTPLIGLLLGGFLVGFSVVLRDLTSREAPDSARTALVALLVAALTIGLLQWIPAGLHADGLADTADGLATPGSAHDKRAVMKRSDLGPVGALTLFGMLGVQVIALAMAIHLGRGSVALVTAIVAGRLALVWAVRQSSASTKGLGAWVSGTVGIWAALIATAVYWLITIALLFLDDDPVKGQDYLLVFAIPLALIVTAAVNIRLRKRFGGMSGDTLGADVEIATTVALVAFAVIS